MFRKAYNEGEDEKYCFEVIHDLRTEVLMSYERERCTYPNHYIALRNQRPIAGVGNIDYMATFPEMCKSMAVPDELEPD